MKMKRNLPAIILIIIILSALFIGARSYLPVVRVEGENLLWRDFSKSKAGLMQFRELSRENVSDLDIEKGIILDFAENVLVRQELERRGKGREDTERIIDSAISRNELSNLEDAVVKLYGWSMKDFEKFILHPQSQRILMIEELQKENINPDEWLEKSLLEAKISIYLPRWKWQDGEIKERY